MRKFTTVSAAILMTIMALSLSGCLMVIDPDELGDRPFPQREYNRTMEFKPGGNLSVENDRGSIVISGGTENSLEIRSAWRLRKPAGTNVGIAGLWDDVPDVKVNQKDDLVTIKAGWPEWPGTPMEVACELKTTSSVNLKEVKLDAGDIEIADLYGEAHVHLGKGQVTVTNYSGSLKADVGEGTVTAEVLDLRKDDVIEITVDTGDIELQLEETAGAVVEAEARGGKLESEFKLGRTALGSSVKGTIGSGEARIILRTGNGNIRIVKTSDEGGKTAEPGAVKRSEEPAA